MQRRESRNTVSGPYPHRRRWRVVLVTDGKRRDFLYESQGEALAFIRATEKELGQGKTKTVSELIVAYRDFLRDVKENKKKSILSTEYKISRILAASLSGPIRQVTKEGIEAKYGELVEELAADSHRNMLAEVKTFFRWAVSSGHIRVSPAEAVSGTGKRRRGKPQLRFDEARRLSGHAKELAGKGDQRGHAVLLALELGMRCSEIVAITARDIDAQGRLLWVTDSKTEAGKRTLPISKDLRPLLLGLARGKAPADRLFTSNRREWVRKSVIRLCHVAKVPVVPPHGLRCTFATLAKLASDPMLAERMGHTNEAFTDSVYVAPGTVQGMNAGRVAALLSEKNEGPGVSPPEPSLVNARLTVVESLPPRIGKANDSVELSGIEPLAS